ncbi:tetratricopeptide repeat protein [Colwellia sp. D2M02]|uniref:Tetratricopeptide repeat protein n=1 Tax=Colwellia asteriadis TaxID=517723 RepID=A0ABN1L681_9GAMM|nr:tetratricopeptide repeat protein [Colwellia sp. D2M02]MBU2893840.1 tetratricopeptide repeat protein [Colwellia sp. D2M02]
MNCKPIYLTTLFLALSHSVVAFASTPPLKVAVIEGATATNDLVKGSSKASIYKIKSSSKGITTNDDKINLCVAYLQAGKLKKSESACTAAINSIEAMSLESEKALYLTSLSYSNRAISRYKNNDISGAIEDLNTAVSIDPNTIAMSNLNVIKQHLYTSVTDRLTATSSL